MRTTGLHDHGHHEHHVERTLMRALDVTRRAGALLLISTSVLPAQQVPAQSFRDSVIGWIKVYKFTGARTPLTVDDKHYSPAQLSIVDSLANWIQASYVPKGALGDVIRSVSPRLNEYNRNDAAKPQAYGAYAKTYTELKRDASGKLVPFTNSHLTWSIQANLVFGEPVSALNTPDSYYFVLPNIGATKTAVKADAARYDLSRHPAISRFFTYFNDALLSTNSNATYVVLSRDNTLPFVAVTKGEYLDKLAGAVERKHVADTEYAMKGWPEGNARNEALRYANEKHKTRLSLLDNNRKQYGSQLQEPARVSTMQPDALLENYKDAFEGNGGAGDRYTVYKVDPTLAAQARSDTPQWIVVWWDGDLLDPIGKQHMDAIVNNFDFQYLHDFFFDPEKVRGRSYKPLHAPPTVGTVVR